MTLQHRKYQLKPGAFDSFVAVWTNQVVPLRRQFGFDVAGVWTSRVDEQFIWMVSHGGDTAAFEAAERAYYESGERSAIDPNPGDLIERADVNMVELLEAP